jgi:hypothetical protein
MLKTISFMCFIVILSGLFLTTLSPDQCLLQEGKAWHVRSIATGQLNDILQKAAHEHASYEAHVEKQGHQFWQQRVEKLRRQLSDCSEFSECANESWPDQNMQNAAYEVYKSWKKSPGHWASINGYCDYYGYSMVLGRNGVWYACAIFATKR